MKTGLLRVLAVLLLGVSLVGCASQPGIGTNERNSTTYVENLG